jgi:hypothetical protein
MSRVLINHRQIATDLSDEERPIDLPQHGDLS